MGAGSSFTNSPSAKDKNIKSEIKQDNSTEKSDKSLRIPSKEQPQKRTENYEPFTLICLDEYSNENDETLRSVIDFIYCFNQLEQCEQFILKHNKNDHLFFIVSNEYATNIVSHIHDLKQIIAIYIIQEATSSDIKNDTIGERWTRRYSKVNS